MLSIHSVNVAEYLIASFVDNTQKSLLLSTNYSAIYAGQECVKDREESFLHTSSG